MKIDKNFFIENLKTLLYALIIAIIITTPPINTLKGGISFKNSQTQIGPKTVSESINSPIVADAVDLEPIVIQINPRAS